MSHARIRSVRLKSGGAEITLLRRATPDGDGTENWCGEVVRSAKAVASFSEPGSELCGYVVVGIYADGMHSLGFRYDESRARIPAALMPALVAELIRTDVVTQRKIEKMMGWT